MSDEKVELKPCPCCNGTELRPVTSDDPYTWCCNTSCWLYDMEFHYEKWNNRDFAAWNTRAGEGV